MFNQMKDAFRKLKGQPAPMDGSTINAEPELSAVPETTEQQGETPAAQIQIPDSARKVVYRFIRRHPGCSKNSVRNGIELSHAMVDSVLEDGVKRGDLTMASGARNAQQFWVTGMKETPALTVPESSIVTSPETNAPIGAQSGTPVGAQSTVPESEPSDADQELERLRLSVGGTVPRGFLTDLASAGGNLTVSEPSLTMPDLAPDTHSFQKSEPASEVSVPAAKPVVDPRMARIITFLQASGECSAREICGGSGLSFAEVNRLLIEGIESGIILQDNGFENRRRYRLPSFQPKQPEAQPVPWIHPDAIWSANERKRVLAEEKLRNPEPPVKKPAEPQLSDIKEPVITWTEEQEHDWQVRHRDRRELKY